MKLAVIFLVAFATLEIESAPTPIANLKLKFKVSGRDFADKDEVGSSDPYLELFYTEDNKKEEIKIAKTSVLLDTLNPDWGESFEFEFVRSKRQRFIFRIYDEDTLSDDVIGHAYVEVADFVDKQQHLTANLNKKGYIIIQTLNPVVTPAPDNPAPTPSSISKNVTAVNTATDSKNNSFAQVVQGTPTYDITKPQKLRVKFSATNLLNKDTTAGHSDPFVEMYSTEKGSSKQTKVGTTKVIDDNGNPIWPDIFEFNYDPAKAQKWFFEVKDSDFGDNDGLGKAEIYVTEYVSKGQKITLNLSKQQGTLTIESPVPPTPNGNVGTATVKSVAQPAPTVATKPPTPAPTKATPPPIRKLFFKLSVRGLEDRDFIGTSDPYIKVYYQVGLEPEVFVKNTQKTVDKEDVDFPDVFEFNYDPSKNSKLRFLVLDEDDNLRDEELGEVSTDVAEYVKSGENLTLKLKKGTLTISKA